MPSIEIPAVLCQAFASCDNTNMSCKGFFKRSLCTLLPNCQHAFCKIILSGRFRDERWLLIEANKPSCLNEDKYAKQGFGIS